jgi:hypothetical protein
MEIIIGAIIAITLSFSIIVTALDLMNKNKDGVKEIKIPQKIKESKVLYFDHKKIKIDFLYFYGSIKRLNIDIESIFPIKVEKEEVLSLVDDLVDDSDDYFFVLFNDYLFLQVEREHRNQFKITYRKNDLETIKLIPDFDINYYVKEIFSEIK